MMPTTRSASRNVPPRQPSPPAIAMVRSGSEDVPAAVNGAEVEGDGEYASEQESLVQTQMKTFMRSVRKLEEDLKRLRKKNRELQQQVNTYRDEVPVTPRKRRSTNVETTIRVQNLENRVRELEQRNSKLNKKIKRLRQKELKAEAEELNGEGFEGEFAGQDGMHKMQKLLRRFSKQMSITTLAEEEDCPICFERLKPKKSYALPCEHLICAECLPQVSRGADETINCPQCRQNYPREEVDLLQFTETERWDELLKLASEYARMDYVGSDSSSERAEEEFICEDESRIEPSDRDETEPEVQDGGDDGEDHEVDFEGAESPRSTPEPVHPHSYAASPTNEKRKRLESLALLRSKKPRTF